MNRVSDRPAAVLVFLPLGDGQTVEMVVSFNDVFRMP